MFVLGVYCIFLRFANDRDHTNIHSPTGMFHSPLFFPIYAVSFTLRGYFSQIMKTCSNIYSGI